MLTLVSFGSGTLKPRMKPGSSHGDPKGRLSSVGDKGRTRCLRGAAIPGPGSRRHDRVRDQISIALASRAAPSMPPRRLASRSATIYADLRASCHRGSRMRPLTASGPATPSGGRDACSPTAGSPASTASTRPARSVARRRRWTTDRGRFQWANAGLANAEDHHRHVPLDRHPPHTTIPRGLRMALQPPGSAQPRTSRPSHPSPIARSPRSDEGKRRRYRG